MANVLFTTYCNRNCAYCFAKGKVDLGQDQGNPSKNINSDALQKIIRFFKRSQLTRFVVLGGEPTLNPEFPVLIDRILIEKEFKSVMIFTNGLIPEDVVGYLAGHPDPRIRIALNLNAPDSYPAGQWKHITTTMKALGPKVGLGVNVYQTGQDYQYLIESILEYNLNKHVRVGITQPIVGSENTFAQENDFQEIASDLLNFAAKAHQKNISFSFDCGFQFCMFTLEQHKELLRLGIKFKAVCNPIIDIGPDLCVWRCFPFLNDVGGHLADFQTKNQIIDYYNRKYKSYKPMGNKPECPQCRYRVNGLCAGGCLARTLISFQH
jgi:radical SAM protein with 4Fe4S-binding SPASM domain